jgi:hypothetical protein
MTRRMSVLLVLVALLGGGRAAQADHVWRVWCGQPLTARDSVFDTSAECNADRVAVAGALPLACRDSKTGPRKVGGPHDGEPINGPDTVWVRTCAEFVADRGSCVCRPEVVE